MNKLIKFTVFIVLFTGFAVCSFGDSFYNLTGGFYRLYEVYPKEDYGRDMEGANFTISLNYYPETFPIGWFIRTSFGGSYNGFEWEGKKMEPMNIYSSSDIQISAGPSYKLQLGSIVHVPLSLGPVFTNTREETETYMPYTSGQEYPEYSYSTGFFSAMSFGLLADVSILVNPFNWLTIINGINMSWDFLRWERGYMQGNLRNVTNGQFAFQNYHAFKIGFYFGVGLHFGQ